MSSSTIAQLIARIPQCMRRDQHRFRQAVKSLQHDAAGVTALAAKIAASIQHRQTRLENLPAQNYPDELPVSQRRDDIAAAIRDHQVVIVAGEARGKPPSYPKSAWDWGGALPGLLAIPSHDALPRAVWQPVLPKNWARRWVRPWVTKCGFLITQKRPRTSS